MVAQLQRLPFLLYHNQKRKHFHWPSAESSVLYAVICQCLIKQIMPFKNLPLNFFFAEAAILCLLVKCKTFFVVILNGICVLALNIIDLLQVDLLASGASLFGLRSGHRALKSREVDLSHLRDLHLRFPPNIGSSVTGLWGFRLHLLVLDFTSGM